MLKNLFKKTFDIRDGEIRISFFMQLYIFLLITVLLMVKPTINALFLSNLGAAHLPYAYILVAIIAVLTSYSYNRAVKKYSLRIITIATLVFFSLIFMLLSFIIYSGALNDWIYYIYYLSVSLFAVLVTSQFWLIANMVYNAREAKRLFGFIGAGAIAGGIFGGYLTTIIIAAYGTKTVIFIASLLILCCIPILQTVWRMRVRKLNRFIRTQRKATEDRSYSPPFKLILDSKHLTYLAAIVGVGVVMAKLVDFQFSDFANRAIPDSDELASFFGFWFSSFNVVALFIQLFLTNRLLAWLGVTTNLLILPLGIAIGCLLFLTFPELWVLIIIKGMDGSFKQSINKAGIELSILPIPFAIKSEAKAFIDVVVDSIATGLAGLLLIFVIRKLELSTWYITIIILLFLFIWIVLIYKLREAYFESFRSNIKNSLDKNDEENTRKKLRASTKATIVLTLGDEKDIIIMLERLSTFRLRTYEPYIIKLLDNPSNKVKAAAIEQLYFYRKGTAMVKIRQLINLKDDHVVYNAMEYLLNHTNISDESIFRSYLDNPSDYISNAALLCLAKEAASNQKLAAKYDLKNRIQRKIYELSTADNDLRKEEIGELLTAVAYAKEPRFYSFISAHFNNRDHYVVEHAIRAAGIAAHEPFIDNLLNFIAEDKYRKTAIKALKKFGVGITKTILALDLAETLNDEVKPFVPKIIGSFKTRDSVKVLFRLLKSNSFIIRMEASKYLTKLHVEPINIKFDQRNLVKTIIRECKYYRNTINAIASVEKCLALEADENQNTDLHIELHIARESLLDILIVQQDQSLECIFNLLRLKYDQADIDVAYFGLKSDSKDTKINALEFLDNLLQSSIKNRMMPLLEFHLVDNDHAGMSSYEIKVLSEKQVLLMLLKNRGGRMQLAVLNVMKHSGNSAYLKTIKPLLKHSNKKIRLFAQNTYNNLSK